MRVEKWEKDVNLTWREIKMKEQQQQCRDRSHLDRLMVMREGLRSLEY